MQGLTGVFVVAAVATVADFTWYSFGIRHTMLAGVVHGAILLMTVGGAIGSASGRFLRGLPIGALAGIAGAASYYALVALVDRRTYGSAIPAAWVLTWFYLAVLDGRWVRAPRRRSWGSVALRGAVAAIGSGVTFYLVMNVLWGRPPEGGRSYLVQFLAWAFAWAPGLLALTAGNRGIGESGNREIGQSGNRGIGESENLGIGKSGNLGISESGNLGIEESVGPRVEETPAGSISGGELLRRIDLGEPLHILDVRSEAEFEAGHVPGAVNISFMQVSGRLDEVPGGPDDELVVYCGHGPRAYIAAAALRRAGRHRIVYMSGHWAGWQAAGLRVER
jgi:rhodanese-related sulfurtransferase